MVWRILSNTTLTAASAFLAASLTMSPVQAQTPDGGLLDPLAAAIENGDSGRVRTLRANPELIAALAAAGQTAALDADIGRSEGLDPDLRRKAFADAVNRLPDDLRREPDERGRIALATRLFDLRLEQALFLERDILGWRLATLPDPDRDNALRFSALVDVSREIFDAFDQALRLLPDCREPNPCPSSGRDLLAEAGAFRAGLAKVVELGQRAAYLEDRAYDDFDVERRQNFQARRYGAAEAAFRSAAGTYEEAAGLLGSVSPGSPGVQRLLAYRDRALQRAAYSAQTAADRGVDFGLVIPPPLPPPPPQPPPPIQPPPPPVSDTISLTAMARAAPGAALTAYETACRAHEARLPKSAEIDVFYATTRRPLDRPDRARDLYFGTVRETVSGGRLNVNYGVATVNVPCERERGDLPRPRVLLVQLEPISSAKHFHLTSVAAAPDRDRWLADIGEDLEQAGRKEVLLYVHGYNNGFTIASFRAAQLHADLGIDGATVFYSWASRERLLAYGRDRDTVESAEEIAALADTLVALRQGGAERVYLVAHSMGNRLMLAALQDVADRGLTIRFDHLVLGSADIEEKVFKRHWSTASRLVQRATLYASDGDRAMFAADLFAGERRIGDAGPRPLTFAGVDTIDTTAVGGQGIGHDDYSRGGLGNLQASLWFDVRPDERCILEPRGDAITGLYWRIREEAGDQTEGCPHAVFSDAVSVARVKGSFNDALQWVSEPEVASSGAYVGQIRTLIERLAALPTAPIIQ